ncbi:unnamed protein product [Caenorhabditis angaria]|uniref:Uncharacterized protein n=1 Tax=Caenorhabditis angaria TaxID=860376 RepID=A0A9P1N1E4_9PELO|nr:unnamed protein product [Caenorhabditis angaria]
MLESPESVVVWSRPPSLRSLRSGKKVVPGQYVLDEPDTLCVLPSSMRLCCLILTCLLLSSLVAAIINNLQTNSNGSASYCKKSTEIFRPEVLCPRESMFFFYKCCKGAPANNLKEHGKHEEDSVKCCARIRIWLLLAIICVGLSCLLGISYTVYHYFCRQIFAARKNWI